MTLSQRFNVWTIGVAKNSVAKPKEAGEVFEVRVGNEALTGLQSQTKQQRVTDL